VDPARRLDQPTGRKTAGSVETILDFWLQAFSFSLFDVAPRRT
jgi:hypothetical protein